MTELDEKPNGKILFGCDFLHLMAQMEFTEYQTEKKYASITATIASFFLLQWGFSDEEIRESKALFLRKCAAKTVDLDIHIVIERIVGLVKNDKSAQERLIIELTAIAVINQEVSEEEKSMAQYFANRFDLSPSEFQRLIKGGIDWANWLTNVGIAYIESGIDFNSA
jgi:hypothetical protein